MVNSMIPYELLDILTVILAPPSVSSVSIFLLLPWLDPLAFPISWLNHWYPAVLFSIVSPPLHPDKDPCLLSWLLQLFLNV